MKKVLDVSRDVLSRLDKNGKINLVDQKRGWLKKGLKIGLRCLSGKKVLASRSATISAIHLSPSSNAAILELIKA